MSQVREYLQSICGDEKGNMLFESIWECVILRSDWAVIAERGKGVILSLSIAEDEPILNHVYLVKIASSSDDWSAIFDITEDCYSPRLIEHGGVVVSVCEDEEPTKEKIKETICNIEKPIVICTSEWL